MSIAAPPIGVAPALGRWGCLALALLAACGGPTEPEPEPPSQLIREVRGTDTVVTLLDAVPDPPIRAEYNAWVVQIATTDGTLLDGCDLTVDPRMPAHGHGTRPTPEVTPVDGEEGAYRVSPLNLFMPGLWEITLRYTCEAIEDEVAFTTVVES